MASSSSAAEIIDVCDDTDEDEPQPPSARKQPSRSRSQSRELICREVCSIRALLKRVSHIAQQSNCVGCDGRGLAQGVADALPYGCPYKDRRRQTNGPNVRDKFAIQEDGNARHHQRAEACISWRWPADRHLHLWPV